MSTENLEIVIEATVQNGVKGVQNTVKALNDIPKAADKANTAIGKVAPASDRATQALSNLGRVAQDAPFGFIGISNNLSPLLESFQRLKAESGSTGGALKALGGSLVGAGGIGLALSAVTAAVSFAQMGFRAWGGAAKESAKKVKEAADEVKIFSDSIGKEILQVQVLGKTISDANIPMAERLAALKELRKQYPDYLQGLTDEEALTKGVAAATRALTIEIIRRAVVEAQQTKISKIVADNLEKITANINETAEKAKASRKNFSALFNKKQVEEFNAEAAKTKSTLGAIGADGFTELNQGQIKSLAIFTEIQKILGPLVDDLFDLGGAFGKVGGEAEKGTNKAKAKLKELKEDIEKFNPFKTASLFGQTALILDAVVKFRQDQVKDEIKNIQDFVNTINKPINIPVSIGKLGIVGPIQEALTEISAQTKLIEEAAAYATESLIADAVKRAEGNIRKLKESLDSFKQQADLLRGIAAGLVESVGEGIGNALAGVKNPFSSFMNVIANGLQSLGKYLIEAATLIKGVKAAMTTAGINDAALIIGGAALVALGAAIKAKVNQTKFAEGGIVTGPTSALIGEAGQSEVVLPLSYLSGMLSRQSGLNGRVVFEIEGQKLVGVLSRANASRGRTYG